MTKLGLVITDGVGYRNFVLSDFLDKAKVKFDKVIIYSFIPKEAFKAHELTIVELSAQREQFHHWFLRKFKEIAHLRLNSKDNFGIQDNLSANYNRNFTTRGLATRLIYLLTYFFHSEGLINGVERCQMRFLRAQKTHADYRKSLAQDSVNVLLFTHQRPPYLLPLVAAAQELKLKTAAFIFSWDNLASKGRMAASFDHYMVWSDLMKRELMQFYRRIRPEQASVVGTPQFVPYVMPQYQCSKADFHKKFALAPDQPTLCFSCGDVSTSPNDSYYIEIIAQAMDSGVLPKLNLLVRTSPAESGDRFEALKHRFSWIQWNHPKWPLLRSNHQENWSQRIPDAVDVLGLRAILTHSDLNINMLSTMSLDFMLHDKPVINPVMGQGDFGLGNDQRFLNYAHIRHLTDSVASKIAKTPEALIQCIQEYLKDDTDQSRRKAFVDQQIGVPLNGTTDKILASLNSIAL
ncbi:hypothetical protein N9L39_01650 [Flavobacteriaceae bacterium]|nr:hypothetical protein [Flavobacteriaceae bacterium]